MVDQFHQADIEVMLDVVYNHTGEGGFWRERLEFDFNPDPSITPQLTNFDPKEVVGLYNFRGFDNHAYYALTDDQQTFWNNTGVGNETRCNHTPFRKHIVDSLRYWVEEMHVDGFRFDLAPVLGEKDLKYYVWDDPKNTVLQDIVDDPVLQKYNTRSIAEPWAAGGYDLGLSFNGPNNNELSNGYGTRIGLFPAATSKPGTGWGEWNGRFRDWWRAFQNNDGFKLNSTEVKDGGFFLTGSADWYQWNTAQAVPLGELRHRARRLHHVRPVLVRQEAERLRPAQPHLLHRAHQRLVREGLGRETTTARATGTTSR